MKTNSNYGRSLGANYFVSSDWNFASFKNLVKTRFNKFNLSRINEFVEKLNTFKRIFLQINPELLNKNGFNHDIIERYTPILNAKLFEAFVLKSDLLDREQLPGQIKMFAGLGLPFDSARTNNINSQDGTEYERQEPLSNKIISGRECEISFTVSKVVSGHYALIESDYLQPSHIGNMQNPLHFIPEAQPRNRAMSQSGHSTPKIIAENLRPSEIIEGATAYTGAPIINIRGEVIQGNGRAYTMKYYYANYPKDEAGYKKWILKNGMYYGFSNKQITKFINPIMVRMVDVTDLIAIGLGQFTQKDLEAVASETTQVKSKAGLISMEILNKIIDELLSNDNGDKTLPELIRDSNVLKVLIKENIIRTDDLELYKRNDVINETGVNFITKLLLNLIFKESNVNTPDVFATLPVSLQKAIEKSALYILKCTEDQSISKEIGNAIIGLRDYLIFKPNGSINEWKRQIDIFDNSVKNIYSDLEFRLIEIFAETTTQKQIVEYFKKYAFWATDQKGDMFEAERPGMSKTESVKKVFGIDLIAEAKPKVTVSQVEKNKNNSIMKKMKPENNFVYAKAKALALEIELDLFSLDGLGKIDEEILDELAHLYENASIGKRVISPVRLGKLEKAEAIKLQVETGKDFTLFRREIFYNDARHIYNNHGRPEEKYRNQIAVTTNDFLLIPIILKKYDSVEFEPKEKGKNSSDCLIYRKKFAGKYFIVEEIIYQENLLKVKTMRIEK